MAMDEGRSKEVAWSAVRRIWTEETSSPRPAPGLGHISEAQMKLIFDSFWESQFEDDRTAVRRSIGQLAELIMADAVDDEA